MSDRVDFEQLSRHRGPEESVGYLLWRVSMEWRRSLEAILQPLGLTHPQFVVLAVIGWLTKEGGRTSQADIAKSASLDPNTASQIIRGLERKSLVVRTRSDERSKNPVLTPAGRELLVKALPVVEKADASFFSMLSSCELSQLKGFFQRFILR